MPKDRTYFRRNAIRSFRTENNNAWVSAFWCAKVVGNYDRGETLGLAEDSGKSTDTIEDRAHAYFLYDKLRNLNGGTFRNFVRLVRLAPYIYISHFRALYDLQIAYKLNDYQVLDLLQDLIQYEGGLSTRKLDAHVRSRYGDTRGWDYYAAKAMKELNKTLQSPDIPQEGRDILVQAYNWIGENA